MVRCGVAPAPSPSPSPRTTTPAAPPQAAPDRVSSYNPLSTLRPTSWSPVLESDGRQLRIGFATGGIDVFSKTGDNLTGAITDDSFWSGFAHCGGAPRSDPTVNYDEYANRWVYTEITTGTGISVTRDMSGAATGTRTDNSARLAGHAFVGCSGRSPARAKD